MTTACWAKNLSIFDKVDGWTIVYISFAPEFTHQPVEILLVSEEQYVMSKQLNPTNGEALHPTVVVPTSMRRYGLYDKVTVDD